MTTFSTSHWIQSIPRRQSNRSEQPFNITRHRFFCCGSLSSEQAVSQFQTCTKSNNNFCRLEGQQHRHYIYCSVGMGQTMHST